MYLKYIHIIFQSVVPLSDDSGLVEWLPNLYRMRIIIINIYKVMGIDMQSKELRDICCGKYVLLFAVFCPINSVQCVVVIVKTAKDICSTLSVPQPVNNFQAKVLIGV